MRWLLAVFLLSLSTLASAADVRFDAFYFFQSESVLQQKGINVDSLGRYTRALQSQIYKAFKKTKVAPSTGYVVIAIRSDGATYSWLDMTPTVHEYFDNQIYDIVQKLPPPDVKSGIFVFAMKMAIDTPVFTRKAVPEPADWPAARKRISNPDNIEELVMSLWPD
jgi:hypothetical protein